MKKIKDDVWNMDEDVDLIYSPDEQGYYFHNFVTGKRTKIYQLAYEATIAYKNNKLTWIKSGDTE